MASIPKTQSRAEVGLVFAIMGLCVAAVAIIDKDDDHPGTSRAHVDEPTVECPEVEGHGVEQPVVKPPESPVVEKLAASPVEDTPKAETPHHARVPSGLPMDCKDLGKTPGSPPTDLVGGAHRINGVDVSAYQGEIPWRTLRTGGLRFVIIKATQGTNIVDPAFARNWEGAKVCGIPRGAYHLFDPRQDAEQQAHDFLARLGDDFGELPPALDIELPYKRPFPKCDDYVAGILRWVKIVEDRTGRKPILYFQNWFYDDILCGRDALKAYPLWAAGNMSPAFEHWPWTFWQHGGPGHWAHHKWDLDHFNGDEDSWQTLLEGPER